jgi:hypothetical protein
LNNGLIFNNAVHFAIDQTGRILMQEYNSLNRSVDTIFVGIAPAEPSIHIIATCYPNPFYTNVSFKSTSANVAMLSIYNPAGQVVHTALIQPHASYTLHAATVPKGVLITKLSSDSQNQTIKLIHY